jgi:hypothetical protein
VYEQLRIRHEVKPVAIAQLLRDHASACGRKDRVLLAPDQQRRIGDAAVVLGKAIDQCPVDAFQIAELTLEGPARLAQRPDEVLFELTADEAAIDETVPESHWGAQERAGTHHQPKTQMGAGQGAQGLE